MKPSYDWLALRAENSPEQPALVFDRDAWTYAELNQIVARYAYLLTELGVRPRERVGLALPNTPEAAFSLLALERLGAVPVPLNTRTSPAEMGQQVQVAGCGLLIYDLGVLDRQASESMNLPRKTAIGELRAAVDSLALETVPDSSHLRRDVSGGEVCAVVFTSGSGGAPIGVELTYANCFWSACGSGIRLGNRPDDRWIACLPLFHIGGLSILIRACISGATVILQDGFDPEAVSQAIDRQGATMISLVPTMLHRLITGGIAPLLARLRVILVGGGRLSDMLLQQSLNLGLPISLTYGLTEAASQVSTAPPDQVRAKPGTVGKPLFFNRVTVRSESGDALPAGKVGEIVVEGPTITHAYTGAPPSRGRRVSGQQLFTGDLGLIDEDGDLWIIGRKDDVINSGGEKIHPGEVEQALLHHPAVGEVQVLGVEDAEWGEQVVAVVVGTPGGELRAGDLVEFLRPQIGVFKIPKVFLFLDELPRTASGKADKEEIRRKLRNRL